MLFKIILWLLGQRIAWLMRRNGVFAHAVRSKQLVLQFALCGGRGLRSFEFDKGTFRSRPGWHRRSQLGRSRGRFGERIAIFEFVSAREAIRLLTHASRDDAVMLAALREKKLTVDGDFTLFLWFGWLANRL